MKIAAISVDGVSAKAANAGIKNFFCIVSLSWVLLLVFYFLDITKLYIGFDLDSSIARYLKCKK